MLVIVYGCKKGDSPETEISTHIDISYKNAKGQDLLNPSTSNYYSKDSITLFKIVNGKEIKIFNPFMDVPNDFFIYDDTSKNTYYMRVFLSDSLLVRINSNIVDTISSKIDIYSNGNIIAKEVWYDGKSVWKYEDGYPTFNVQK